MKYERQTTDYNCVPATFRMLLSNLGIKFLSQEDLSGFFKTSETGTYYSNCKPLLKCLGLKMKTIPKKEALKRVKAGKPVGISYQTSKSSSHCAILTDVEDYVVTLQDPYFGKNFKMPTGIVKMLTRKYFILEP